MGRDIKNPPTSTPHFLASRLFGYTQYKPSSDADPYNTQQPSRVIVRDCHLSNEEMLGGVLIEEKAETVIDRITSAAMPRQMERVPAGAAFEMNIVVNIFEKDDEAELVHGVLDGLNLVQDDYLGGAGSRGSGQVRIRIEAMTEKDHHYYTSESKQSVPSIKGRYQSYLPELFEEA